jgi:D-glycero-D-manno-heptose 1,7-bisphosphate phosphatase
MDKPAPEKQKAIFLDRDGTINEEMGYINHIDRFRIFGFVPESLRLLKQLNFKIIVITNQSGIARGYFTESLLNEVHQRLREKMRSEKAAIDDIFYCPHHPTEGNPPYRMECDCRKPKPGMVFQAAAKYDLDLSRSFMVGDRYKDVLFAKNLGIRAGMVLTGYGLGEYTYQREEWRHYPDFIGRDLLDVAHQIERSLSQNVLR